MRYTTGALVLGFTSTLGLAQFPSTPSDITTVKSLVDSAVTISYKQTDICERTAGVKSYSGFVHLPGKILSDIGGYDINSYFVYFEARNNASTAPLAIYLAGGPGESSLYAAMSSESGPCYVNINGTDTVNNPWSFNNNVNLLYIDQPVQTGYSYDKLINATYDFAQGLITPTDFGSSTLPEVNATFGYGTFPSQNPKTTVNTTVQASKALWSFAEHWLSSFPEYTTQSNKVSIWGNSYGGYWVPETAARLSKNLNNLPANHPLMSKNVTVDAIGITNACVDIESGIIGYPDYAYNNTYGIRFGSEAVYNDVLHNLTMPGGCADLIKQCRALGELSDPNLNGSNETVNELCMGAFGYCGQYVINAFPELQQRDPFDIAQDASIPCPFYLPVYTYLNSAPVQQALGVPLNFTQNSNVISANFGLAAPSPDRPISASTGDAVRQNGLPNIEYLLANNVKVAFIFGDRDYRCPWTGGEATALAAKWKHQMDFANAGYQEMQGVITPVEQGGLKAVVKQYGKFSFSRVLDAGHAVSAYAPETVYKIFERTIGGMDVATGQQDVSVGYCSKGPRDSWGWRNKLPEKVPATCMVEGQFQSENPWAALLGNSS